MVSKLIFKDISEKCLSCNGLGCPKCKGRGIGEFWFMADKRSKSSVSSEDRLKCLRKFATYLKTHGYPELTNIQALATFYKEEDKTQEQNIILLEETLSEWVIYMDKEEQLEGDSQSTYVGMVIAAYKRNRVSLDTKNITSAIGLNRNPPSKGYNIDQIKLLLDHSNLRYKALIATLFSSGPRIGGIYDRALDRYGKHNFLKIRDLQLATEGFEHEKVVGTKDTALDVIHRMIPNYEDVYMITYYRGHGEKVEYKTYCSHECFLLINLMLQERRDAGENNPDPKETLQEWMKRSINQDAPVFRNEFDKHPLVFRTIQRGKTQAEREARRISKINHPKPLNGGDIGWYLRQRRIDLKIEYAVTHETEFSKGTTRTPIPILHGFRHTHAGILSKAGKMGLMNESVSEWLQGRKLESSRQAYVAQEWADYERLIEFWKVHNNLTIEQGPLKDTEIVELKTTLHSLDAEKKINDFKFEHILDEIQKLKEDKKRESTEASYWMALVSKFLSPEEMEKARRVLSDSSLPLEIRKAQIIELPTEDNEKGESDG